MDKPLSIKTGHVFDELSAWQDNFAGIASQPLTYCPALPQITKRYEAFWNQAILDRPIFIAYTDKNPSRLITTGIENLQVPQTWFEQKMLSLEQTVCIGDAVPQVQLDLGSMPLAGLWGGERVVGAGTVWTHPFINDEWSNAPDWLGIHESPLWATFKELLAKLADHASGRYMITSPDWGATADLLAITRGSESLCLDLLDKPEQVLTAVASIYPAWADAYQEFYNWASHHGVGVLEWLKVWSQEPYVICACDFSALIGPAHFQRFFLPDIASRAATVGRAMYHLDGPNAIRHVDAILEIPEIKAVQYSPPPGDSCLQWMELYHKIQDSGRSVYIICEPDEVLALAAALKPEGLALILREADYSFGQAEKALYKPLDPTETQQLFEEFCRKYI